MHIRQPEPSTGVEEKLTDIYARAEMVQFSLHIGSGFNKDAWCYVRNGVEMASRDKGGVNPVLYGQLPMRINKGRILVHNNVEHSINATCGRNGFQAWTQPQPAPKELVKCSCGWAGLPHYCLKGD
jgi:hypothetical protein